MENKAFVNACTRFFTLESLSVAPKKKSAAQLSKLAPVPAAKKVVKLAQATKVTKFTNTPLAPKPPMPVSLLKKAHQAAPHEDGWVLLSQLGNTLGDLDGEFKSKYAPLGKSVRAYPDLFEIKGDGGRVSVKLKS